MRDTSATNPITGKPRLRLYAEIAKPLTELTKKASANSVRDNWGPDAQKAFDFIKDQLTAGVHLNAPQPDRPLRMASDASDMGWGGILYWETDDGEHRTVRMWSKCWTEAQSRYPTYYKESLAWCFTMKRCRPYVLSNRFPLITLTDHLPLTWIRKASGKAALSEFLLDSFGDIDYTISYIPGHLNVMADPISRPPFLGPLRPSIAGVIVLTDALLSHLPKGARQCKRPWVSAGRDTKEVARIIQRWRAAKNPIKVFSPSLKNISSQPYDLAVVIPTAERAGPTCYNLLLKDDTFACLVPSSLVHRIAQRENGSYDPVIQEKVQKSPKLAFSQAEYTWILNVNPDHGTQPIHHVYTGRKGPAIQKPAPLPGVTLRLRSTLGDLDAWAADSLDSPLSLRKGAK